MANFGAKFDPGHITHPHRHAIHVLHWHIADVAQTLLAATYPADATDHQLLRAAIQIPAPGVAIIGLDRFGDVITGEPIGQKTVRIELNLILAHFTAKREHLGHSGDRHQQQLDDPVVETAQRDGIEFLPVVRAQNILIHLPQSRGIGSDAGCTDTVGYLFTRGL